jgi:transcriptional regulator GlxA family with amidase domain
VSKESAPHSVWFLLFDDFLILDVCGPLQVFSMANRELALRGKAAFYDIHLFGHEARRYRSSADVELEAAALPASLESDIQTVVISGGPGVFSPRNTEGIVRWLQASVSRIQRLTSVCTGAFVFARTGLLDGRSAVTHWACCDQFSNDFPAVSLERNSIYVRSGTHWTSAGITAGIDMALAMVEMDLGRVIAMTVAKSMVVFYKRPGGQSQFSSALLHQTAGDDRIDTLRNFIAENLKSTLEVPMLAEQLGMSARTFTRFFTAKTGTTPARAVEQIRLEQACNLIESQVTSMKFIAHTCGFGSEEVMRRAFVRHLHVSPTDYRTRFSAV